MLIFWLIAVLGGTWSLVGLIRLMIAPSFQIPNWLWLMPAAIGFWAMILAALT